MKPDSNTVSGINCVTCIHVTQNTQEIKRNVKISEGWSGWGGFMNETEPELNIEEWAEMVWQRVVREKLGQEKF